MANTTADQITVGPGSTTRPMALAASARISTGRSLIQVVAIGRPPSVGRMGAAGIQNTLGQSRIRTPIGISSFADKIYAIGNNTFRLTGFVVHALPTWKQPGMQRPAKICNTDAQEVNKCSPTGLAWPVLPSPEHREPADSAAQTPAATASA